ncbi:MAG: hypothetical protein JWN03_1015 [Nocardia sp.]|uniref:PqqD family protein n=1 Tax=Nocardia sp. TaxID=1821 RepID=UPI002617C28B|nr:PqqD family protein [Nocardia sp.]MCU1640740.1 hypothetical protein [Nocardia sp.]
MGWNAESIPVRRLDIRVRSIRGSLLVVNHEHQMIELADVGALLFRSADGKRTIGELAGLLVAEFGIDVESALADTVEFMADLAATAFIEQYGEA